MEVTCEVSCSPSNFTSYFLRPFQQHNAPPRMQPIIVAFCLVASTHATFSNVNGGALQHCSSAGSALTGFTRNGQCIESNDDAGSHHICIDLSSTDGGNFCTVTGQPDWCSSSMGCDGSAGKCPVKHWCVCQWAFAAYLQKAGGCSKIQDIVCGATNMEALKAYTTQAPKDKSIADALACLKQRCKITTGPQASIMNQDGETNEAPAHITGSVVGVTAGVAGTVALGAYLLVLNRRSFERAFLQAESQQRDLGLVLAGGDSSHLVAQL